MRGIVIAWSLTIAIAVPGVGQSPGEPLRPTDDQLRLSAIEVARLVKLLERTPGLTVADIGAALVASGPIPSGLAMLGITRHKRLRRSNGRGLLESRLQRLPA